MPQRPLLLNSSIRENITFFDPARQFDDVIEAARTACIHDEIMRMPLSYETVLADGASTLSGGQRQRISIAQALCRRPQVLLLDEATSQLDAVTEQIVHRNLGRTGATNIIIAHRLSTVVDADLVLVMVEGRIIERGRHEELLALRGRYAELVSGQMRNNSS